MVYCVYMCVYVCIQVCDMENYAYIWQPPPSLRMLKLVSSYTNLCEFFFHVFVNAMSIIWRTKVYLLIIILL